MEEFDYSLDYTTLDLRKQPELYRIGRGEQGVLSVEPYKSEILPHWRFATPDQARASSAKILEMFRQYLAEEDFVGADMARKFLQMGYTRSRRYANYPGGRKYRGPVPDDRKGQSGSHGRQENERSHDPIKAESASIFKAAWDEARADPQYLALREAHRDAYERGD